MTSMETKSGKRDLWETCGHDAVGAKPFRPSCMENTWSSIGTRKISPVSLCSIQKQAKPSGKRIGTNPPLGQLPLIVPRKNTTQLITAGTNAIRSYNLENGELIWTADGLTLNAIPCPVVWKDHVILMSGYRGNMARAIHLDSRGKVDGKPSQRWTYAANTPYVPSPPVLVR